VIGGGAPRSLVARALRLAPLVRAVVLLCMLRAGLVSAAPVAVPVYDFTASERGALFPRGDPWAVYEHALIDDAPPSGPSGLLPSQSHWSRFAIDGERRLPAYGCHTFHARVQFPPAWLDGKQSLAISFPYQFHAARVVVRNRGPSGGRWEAESGRPGCSAAEEIPLHRPVRLLFTADGDVDVFVQVSNFHAMRGGLVRAPYVGLAGAVIERRLVQERLDFLIIGVLGVAGIVHLAQWLLRRSQVQMLYFATLCLVMAVRAIVFGNYLESFDPPLMGFAASQRLVYITIDGAVFFTIAYLDAALPNTLPRAMFRAFGVACGSLSALVLLLDVTTFGPLIFFSQALAGIGSLIVLASGARAALRDRNLYSSLMLASFLVLAGAAVSDIVIDHFRIGEFYVAPYGTMGFVLMQAFALALQNASTREAADQLSAALAARSERLEQLDALKNEFLATTSHELRTPLNGIVGLSETLLQRTTIRDDREVTNHILAIGDAGRRLTSLIDDILDYSKLRTRKIVLDRKPVDIRRVIDQVLLLSRSLPGTKPIDLRQSVDHTVPYVLADENRLRQILQNLVGNAIKFTDRGFVEVAAAVAGERVEIRVRDSGIGIPEDKFEHIFATFEQLDMGPSRRAPGTGLGLAITKQLVELHGGTIAVHSAIGLGSTFVFTVPVATGAPEPAVGALTQRPEASAVTPVALASYDTVVGSARSRWRILAVDDDAANLLVLRAQLDANEFNVTPVRDARDAVRVFKEEGPFDAVLLDVMMPKVSGLEVARELRRIVTSAECPILFLSARTALDDFAAAFGAGGSDFLTKPVVRTELLARLKHHLDVAVAFRARERPLEVKLAELLAAPCATFVVCGAPLPPHDPALFARLIAALAEVGAVPVFAPGGVALAIAPAPGMTESEPSEAHAVTEALSRAIGGGGVVCARGAVTLAEGPDELRIGARVGGEAVEAVLAQLASGRRDDDPLKATGDR
jgi:two-component system sensor histidine kinase ChiS